MGAPSPSLPHDPLREFNRQRVLEHLSREGALSQADLTRLTGLSRTTISSIVSELRGDGTIEDAVVEPGVARRPRGRPATLLTLAPPKGLAAAVDFGQRHLRVAVAELTPKVLVERSRGFDTTRSGGDSLDAAVLLLDEVLAEAGLAREDLGRVVLGVPGPLDPRTGTVLSGVILPGWTPIDPAVELQRRLQIPVTADNDANLGALGEVAFGAGKGIRDVVYVKVASGIGAGLVLGGRLHRGATGVAGEIGHVQAREDGDVCRCGNRGCLETLVSVPRLLAAVAQTHDGEMTVARLLALVQDRDPGAVRVLHEAGRHIGRIVAPLCNALNPSAVIIGGVLSAAGEALVGGVRESVERFTQPGPAEAVTVLAGELGERAEVLGALALAAQQAGHLLRPYAIPD